MNKKQIIVMWIGLLLAVAVILLPHELFFGYRLFSHSRDESDAYRQRVLLAIALLTLGGIVTLKDKR